MIWTLVGTLSFGFLILFEYQKCQYIKKKIMRVQHSNRNPWFLIGTGLLILSCIMLGWSQVTAGIRLWCGIVLLLIGLLIYRKVLAVTDPEGYISDRTKVPVNRNGVYGRMRHPGVWCFLICAIGYGMIFPEAMCSAVWFSILNLFYTWLQDRYFFPVYLEGYDDYQKDVPFMIPKW